MTVALVRRLDWDGVVGRDELDRALFAHVANHVPLLRALVEATPELAPKLESELGAVSDERAALVPDPDLLGKLPPGLPSVLLVVPTGRDPETGSVRVAAAEPGDADLRAELEHHLGSKVVLFAAPVRALMMGLDSIEAPSSRRHPAAPPASSRPPPPRPRPSSSSRPPPQPQPGSSESPAPGVVRMSEPPIPLVRLSGDRASPRTVKGVAPPAGNLRPGVSAPVVVVASPVVPIAEPVIELTRKAPRGASAATAPRSPSSPTASAEPIPGSADHRRALARIEEADTAEGVASSLVSGLSMGSRPVLLFAVRGKVFEGKDASDAVMRGAMRSLVISGDRPSIVLTAVQAGQYIGPIPHTVVHEPLIELLGSSADQIAAFSVSISGRAALVFVLGDTTAASAAVELAQELGKAATRALERIVRKRKR